MKLKKLFSLAAATLSIGVLTACGSSSSSSSSDSAETTTLNVGIMTRDDYLLERDEFELALIAEALRQGKPIFAVCRGMQLLNVALGGSLEQEVANHWQTDLVGTSHRLQVKPQSRVGKLFAQGSQINSFHHQRIKDLASGLVATGLDPRDGTIEAYESKGKQALFGLQWHPEFLYNDCKQHRELFHYLIDVF